MQKSSILFITAFPPNNITAGQNYSTHLLNDLSKDYNIDVVYWKYKEHSVCLPTNVKILHEYFVNSKKKTILFSFLFLLFPFFTTRFNVHALKQIRKLANNYDYLYFDFSQIFIYSLFVKHSHKIKMCHDVISQKYARTPFAPFYRWWVQLSEKMLINKNDTVLCFSEKDKKLLDKLCKCNSFALSFYIDNKIILQNKDFVSCKNYFVFYGAWNRRENLDGLLWFIHNVYPLCIKSIEFKVIGSELPIEVQKIIKDSSTIEYLGFVENPYILISAAKALIAPLFTGAGVKVKVIESLALGVPVIGTDVAFEGINNFCVDGINVLQRVCTFSEFAKAVNYLHSSNVIDHKRISNYFLSNYSNNKFSVLLRDGKF